LNTIVFSALTGLEVNGAADYVTGVHVWFPVNHAVAFPDSYAFHITGAGNRFMGCCTPRQPPPHATSVRSLSRAEWAACRADIDGGRAVFEEKALSRNIWQQGFECCQRGLPAPGTSGSGIYLRGSNVGPGLQIINNEVSSAPHCFLESPLARRRFAKVAQGGCCSSRVGRSSTRLPAPTRRTRQLIRRAR